MDQPILIASFSRFGADLPFSCTLAAAAGVLSHVLYFIRGERVYETTRIILLHALALVLLFVKAVASLGLVPGLVAAAAVSSTYFVALFASIGVYRLYFHPLRRFPGATPFRLTRAYGIWLNRDDTLHLKFLDMHRQYGDFVRMGPNQISIVNLDVFNKIHGPQTRCSKKHAGTYDINRFRGEYNLDTLTDNALHRDRRKVWDQALNTKSLEGYESTTRAVIHDWLGRLDEVQGLPIDTSLYAKLIPFDNMGRVGFSTDFATVKEGREDRMLRMIEISFDVVARMGLVPWPLAFSQDLPRMGLQKEFEELAVRMTDMRIQADSEDKHDIMKFFLEDLHSEKPKTLKNINAVYADAAAVLIGATDTIACALGFLFYYLARDADLRQRLYDAIAPAYGKRTPGEFACIDLQAIEFLDAVINETLRMNTSVPINGPRNTPPEGVEVDGTYIPGNVSVYTPLHLYHRSPKYFVQPDEFIPERWTTRPELVLERRAFQPFHFGRYDCVGKRLARNVIRLTAAYTLWHYDFAFAPGEDGKDFESRAQWKAIVKPGKLECVFRKRER